MISLIVLVLAITINTEGVRVNRLTAEARCSGHDGLVTYESYMEGFITADSFPELQERDSFWVDGFAKSTLTMALYGCLEKDVGIPMNVTKLHNNALWMCSEKCTEQVTHVRGAYIYMGVRGNICYCFNNTQLDNYQVNSSLKECQQECMLVPEYKCHVESEIQKITVYTVYKRLDNTFESNTPYQCETVTFKTDRTLYFAPDSCYYNRDNNTRAFMCIFPEKGKHCPQSIEHENIHYCWYDSSSINNWIAAQQLCINNSGRLLDIGMDTSSLIALETIFWTGQFRPLAPITREFVVPENKYPDEEICIIATKIDGYFYLETSGCYRKFNMICADDSRINGIQGPVLTQDVQTSTNTCSTSTSVIVGCVTAIISGSICFICGGFAVYTYISRQQSDIPNNRVNPTYGCSSHEQSAACSVSGNKDVASDDYVSTDQHCASVYERVDEGYTQLDLSLRDDMSAYGRVQN